MEEQLSGSDVDTDESDASNTYTASTQESTEQQISSKYSYSHRMLINSERSSLIQRDNKTYSDFKHVDNFSTTNNFTNSVLHSVRHFTQSSMFGLSSATFAAMRQHAFEASKTISLTDIPSTDRKTTNAVFFFSTLGMISSLSVFALPYLVAHNGFVSVAMIAIVGALTCYTTLLINKCQYQVSKGGANKRVYLSYIDMGKNTITWHGDTIMKIFVGSNVMTDIYILIFCAQVAVDVFHSIVNIDIRLWAVIWIMVAFPMFFIPKMSILTWFGFISLFFYVVGMVITMVVMISKWKSWHYSNITPPFSIRHFFISYGVVVNSYNYHLAVPLLEGSMIHPKNFKKLTISMFTVCTLQKIMFSVIGALCFGLLTSGSIISNLSGDDPVSLLLQVTIAISMLLMYPTSVFVVFDMLDTHIYPKYKFFEGSKTRKTVWMILSRVLTSTFILALAVSVPNFEMVTSIVGNVRGTLITLVLPVYFYLKLKGRRISKLNKAGHWALIVVACIFGVLGTGFASESIIRGD